MNALVWLVAVLVVLVVIASILAGAIVDLSG